MFRRLGFLAVCGVIITAAISAVGQVGNTATPADGHTSRPRTLWAGR